MHIRGVTYSRAKATTSLYRLAHPVSISFHAMSASSQMHKGTIITTSALRNQIPGNAKTRLKQSLYSMLPKSYVPNILVKYTL